MFLEYVREVLAQVRLISSWVVGTLKRCEEHW